MMFNSNGQLYGQYGTNSFNAKTLQLQGIGIKKPKDQLQEAMEKNAFDSYNEVMLAANLFTTRFRWEGDIFKKVNIQQGYIERLLFHNGFAVAMNHKSYGFLVLAATVTAYNVMNEPIKFMVTGLGMAEEVHIDDCVLIRDNYMIHPPVLTAVRYGDMIADLTRTIEVYGKGMKKPMVIYTTEERKKTQRIVAENYLANEPYILMDYPMDRNSKLVLEKEPPVFHNTTHNATDLNGLMMAKKTVHAEMLSRLGINTNLAQKNQYKSGMEMEDEKQHIDLLLAQATSCREEAAKKMSELAGSNISCINVAEELAALQKEKDEEKEGEEDETNDES